MNNEIQHFGILGMKWGVRRYQNKDGSLTPAGKQRIREAGLGNYKNRDDLKEVIELAGVKEGTSSDVIKKSSILNRYSGVSDETHDNRRKYASLTDYDKESYGEAAFNFELPTGTNNIYLYELEAKKDMKVAKGRDVVSDLVSKYGDKTIKEAFDVVRLYDWENEGIHNYIDEKKGKDKWVYNTVSDSQAKVQSFLRSSMRDEKISSEVFKEYAKKGYDVIVDPEDYFAGISDYPVIVLNPKKSTRRKSVTTLV